MGKAISVALAIVWMMFTAMGAFLLLSLWDRNVTGAPNFEQCLYYIGFPLVLTFIIILYTIYKSTNESFANSIRILSFIAIFGYIFFYFGGI